MKHLLIIILLVSFGLPKTYAQAKNYSNSGQPPIKGVLPNGFTYYIKHLPNAGEDIFMRFYLNAGNRVETEDQPDVSHAIEHLALRASKNFPLGITSNSSLLKKVGMKGLGRDMYGWSGHQGTEYIFNAKAKYPESVDLGFLYFQDILDGLYLTDEDIDIERKVLIQEREGKSSMERKYRSITEQKLTEKLFPCQQSLERYSEEMKNFSADRLRDYYKDWYQPKNVAIVFVGNIENVASLEKKIIKTFSQFHNKLEAKDLPNCVADYFDRPNQFKIVERIEDPNNKFVNKNIEVKLFFRDPLIRTENDVEAIKRQLLWEITIEVLRTRLGQLTQSYNNRFDVEVLNTFKYKNLPAASSVIITSEETNLEGALAEVITKINEVKTYGLTPEEWTQIKGKQNHYLEAINNKIDDDPRHWIDDIKNNFWFGEPLLPDKNEVLTAWLNNLYVNGYNEILKEFLGQVPQDIGVVIPKNENYQYSEKELRSLIERAWNGPVSKKEIKTPRYLIDKEQLQELDQSRVAIEGKKINGAKEYLLENGIRVVLLQKENTGEQVRIWGFSKKGASNLPSDHLISATKAPNIIKESGLGAYDKFEIARFLDSIGGNIHVKPYIGFNETGIKGKASKENMENLLQIVHLYLSAPRKDIEAFDSWKRKELQDLLEPSYSVPQADFDNAVSNYFGRSEAEFLSGITHFKGTQKADLEKAYSSYQALFSDFTNFTFIISGNFDDELLMPRIQRYLGTLKPAKGTVNLFKPNKEKKEIPVGPIEKILKPSDYYQLENIVYSIRYVEKVDKFNWKKLAQVQLLSELVWEMALKLRTQEGFALYDIVSVGEYDQELSIFELFLKLNCLPGELEEIKLASRNIFTKIKMGDIDQVLFEKVSQRMIGYYGKGGRYRNDDKNLYNLYRHGNKMVNFEEMELFLRELTYNDVQEFAKSFIVDQHQYEFLME